MSETIGAPATARALASLETRVARLESDVAHLQRDVGDLKADMKTALGTLGRIDATMARLEERTALFATRDMVSGLGATLGRLEERTTHAATREWVMWRMLSAFLLLVALLVAVVGYAPRLQSFLGTATVASVAPPAR